MAFLDRGTQLTNVRPIQTEAKHPATARVKAVKIARHAAQRVARMGKLRQLMPDPLAKDTTYHFITGGDIDAIGILELFIERFGKVDYLAGAMARIMDTWIQDAAEPAEKYLKLIRK